MSTLSDRVDEARQRWNANDLPGYLTLYDDAIRLHGYSPEPMSKPAVTEFYKAIFAAFGTPEKAPNLAFRETMTDGAFYCCRFTLSGTHNGPFMGVPPTGRQIVLPGITIMKFANGKVIERWSTADMLGLLVQVGAVPPPG